tara:strand:+ start:75 stop:248 length:174 start_codon:yes stop_codon:yes gene_type:complete
MLNFPIHGKEIFILFRYMLELFYLKSVDKEILDLIKPKKDIYALLDLIYALSFSKRR